jgi:hypothetical protein
VKADTLKLTRKIGLLTLTALTTVGITAAVGNGTASAAGRPGLLQVVGPCGDLFDMIERVQGTLVLAITIPSTDPNETWTLTAQQQDYNPVTGGRAGAPINIVPNPLPALAFSPAEGGFTTTANIVDTPGATHGFTYVATRTSSTPHLTCASGGFWTNPGGGVVGPAAQNPTSLPDTAPKPTGLTEADAHTHDVLYQFDQEMLSTSQGIPATSRFTATVNGVNRAVTGITVINDSPPGDAVVDVTLGGAALVAGATVAVQYRVPLTNSQPALQDLDTLHTANWGPTPVTVF